MSRTTATRKTDGDRLRLRAVTPRTSRPGGVGFGTTAEQPPILFRLPALDIAEVDAERHAVAIDQASPVPESQTPSLFDVPKSPTESSCVADDFMVRPHAHEVTMETCVPQSHTAEATASETATTPTVAVAIANSDPVRTWWEHWSSGVVLILLIIALVTASIIALNDGGKAKPDSLASQAESSMVGEFDLSSITIPEISNPAVSSHPSINGNPADPLSKDTALSLIPVAVPSVSASEQLGATALLGAATQVATTVTTPTDSVASPSAERAGEALKLAATSTPAAALAPQATLDQPVGVTVPQLFANGDSQPNAVQNNAVLGVPSMTASNPTASLELPSAASSADTALPANTVGGKSATDGSSPTLYDGASRILEQHAAYGVAGGQVGSLETQSANMPTEGFVHSAEGLIDTNMPSYPTILVSATGDTSGVGAAARIVPSTTPDLNGSSLLSEFMKYDKMRQASVAAAGNRFPNSTTIAPQQVGASQSPGSGTGFTLGNPQAVAPPLPR